jgi:hypothetical protein
MSIADPARVFWWRGELYRAIPAHLAGHYRDLFSRGIFQSLMDQKLLVDTQPCDLQLPGCEMVLKHKAIRFVTYAPEWPGAMLKSAAELILTIAEQLLPLGLMLQDAHPYNVLFDGVGPVFVDIGSIVPLAKSGRWPASDEFRRFFIHPLKIIAAGHGHVARWLLHDYSRGASAEDAAALCGQPAPQPLPSTAVIPAADSLRSLRLELDAIQPVASRTEWSNYSAAPGSFPGFSPGPDWNQKHRTMHAILSKLKAADMLDIGANRGWFSQLAAHAGTQVLATDVDEQSLNLLHADTLANGLPIQPAFMDLANPFPGYGINNSGSAPALDRFQCDLVLALAVVHHVVARQYQPFELIVSALSALSRRWLVVEFIASEDEHVRRWSPMPDWYTLENFKRELSRHFRTLEEFPSDLQHRVILLCEK